MGKKKKREKHVGLSLSRIGACLVPGAIFAAVPSTARGFSETWPRRKKNLSALSTALGSVGNLAQAIVVAEGSKENINENGGASNETLDNGEDYESEGHYAVVDEHIVQGRKDQSGEVEMNLNNSVEAIYAKVNKNRKTQERIKHSSSSSGSGDDITSVSGMGSEDEDSSTAANRLDSKSYSRKRTSKKRSNKELSKKCSPRSIPERIKEELVTKTDVNDNMIMASDFPEEFVEEPHSTDFETNLQNEFPQLKEDTHDSKTQSMDHLNHRNFNSPTQFEREEFNETDLYNYSDEGSPLYSKRDEIPLGASASVPVFCSSDVPPLGERKTPIGKGISSESIHSYKEKWQALAHSTESQELGTGKRSHVKDQTLEKSNQEALVQHRENMKHRKKENKQKEVQEGEQILERQQSKKLNQRPAEQHREGRKQFSQSAQLVRQQIEVANKLRALSAQGSYKNTDLRDQKTSNDGTYPVETTAGPQANRQENLRLASAELGGPEVKSDDTSVTVDHVIPDEHSRRSERRKENKRKKKTIKKDERSTSVPDSQDLADPHTSSLQQMSTMMAKEACRKLYLQVKTLDREKSALEALSQSLNEENATLKKLNESLTKNIDNSNSGISISLLQIQIEELKEENDFLKNSVHRLNVELGRYQAKYRLLSSQEVDQMFKSERSHPAWLVNKKYIAPLFLAYDDRIKEKQRMIETYEEQLQGFKNSLGKIMDENLQLQEKLEDSEVTVHNEDEWRQLEEQAKLVLSENQILMERQELHNKKLEDITSFYKGEIAQLSEKYEKARSEKGGLELKLEVMNATLNGYKQELETSSTQWKKHIPVEEHLDTVSECRRKLQELQKNTQDEINSLTFQFENARNENKSLNVQLADLQLANAQLEREVYSFTEVQRKNERKTLLLKEKLSNFQQREATAQDTLNEVLEVAEKTALERDALNEMLTNEQLENKKVQSLVRLEGERLMESKNKASLKITTIKGRVKDQERANELLKERYENEIENLKTLVRRQQSQLDDMVNDKRSLENELAVIYEKVADNNDNM